MDFVIGDFDQFKSNYTDLVDESIRFSGLTADFFLRAKARCLAEETRRRFGDFEGIRALDIGCGLGSMHPHISSIFGSLTGVDVASETIEMARKNNPWVTYKVSDGRRLPVAGSSFEVVFAVCVMHHVTPSEWPAFVAEASRVAAPGGLVVIFEHNPYNPLTRRVVRRSKLDVGAVLIAASKLTRICREAGLRDVRSRHILFSPFEGRFGRMLEKVLGKAPFGAQYYVSGRKE